MTTTSPYPTTERARGGLPKWVIPVAIIAVPLLLLLFTFIGSRNGLVNKDEAVNQQFGQVDVAQQRRFDLIPGLVNATKAVLNQEQKVFGDIATARTQYGGARTENDKVEATNQLESSLSRLLVIVENYPQLQSNQTVQNLMTQLEGTENRIAQERRGYNEVVTDYNRSIRRFPTSIVAGMSGFERRTLFVGKQGSADPPAVNLDLNSQPVPTPSES